MSLRSLRSPRMRGTVSPYLIAGAVVVVLAGGLVTYLAHQQNSLSGNLATASTPLATAAVHTPLPSSSPVASPSPASTASTTATASPVSGPSLSQVLNQVDTDLNSASTNASSADSAPADTDTAP